MQTPRDESESKVESIYKCHVVARTQTYPAPASEDIDSIKSCTHWILAISEYGWYAPRA